MHFGQHTKNLLIKKRENRISIADWEVFYGQIFHSRLDQDMTFFGTFDLSLDTEISITKIEKVIKNIKCNKAPGFDEINANFYKNLPSDWLNLLQILFNNVLHTEMALLPGLKL